MLFPPPDLTRQDTDALRVTNFEINTVDDVIVEDTNHGTLKLRVMSHYINNPDEDTPSGIDTVHQPNDKRTKTLADFELLKVLGRGAFGKVYLVSRQKHGRTEYLAMKVMRKREIVERNVINNIHSERCVLATVDHPFLVKLRYAFQTEHKLYLLMSYVGGGEMFTRLEKIDGFIESHAKFYAAEIALAFKYLHAKGIVYRDLKPENVLFTTSGHVCLTDFGFAKQYGSSAEESKSFCGSLQYLAPEIVQRAGHSYPADWWTLGILIYEMVTTQTPFGGGSNRKKIEDNILKKKITFPKTFSPPLISLLKGLLNRDSSKRFTFEDIKKHDFFFGIDWDKLEKKQVTPPWVPVLENEMDVSNFDERFTIEPVVDSPILEGMHPSDGGVVHDAFTLRTDEDTTNTKTNTNTNTNTVNGIPITNVPDVILQGDVPMNPDGTPATTTGGGILDGTIIMTNLIKDVTIMPSEGAGYVRGQEENENKTLEPTLLQPQLSKSQQRALDAHYTADNNDDRNLFKGFDFQGESPSVSAMNTPLFASKDAKLAKMAPPKAFLSNIQAPISGNNVSSQISDHDDDDDDDMHFSMDLGNFVLNDTTTTISEQQQNQEEEVKEQQVQVETPVQPTQTQQEKEAQTSAIASTSSITVVVTPPITTTTTTTTTSTTTTQEDTNKSVVDFTSTSTSTTTSSSLVPESPMTCTSDTPFEAPPENRNRDGLWHHRNQHKLHTYDYAQAVKETTANNKYRYNNTNTKYKQSHRGNGSSSGYVAPTAFSTSNTSSSNGSNGNTSNSSSNGSNGNTSNSSSNGNSTYKLNPNAQTFSFNPASKPFVPPSTSSSGTGTTTTTTTTNSAVSPNANQRAYKPRYPNAHGNYQNNNHHHHHHNPSSGSSRSYASSTNTNSNYTNSSPGFRNSSRGTSGNTGYNGKYNTNKQSVSPNSTTTTTTTTTTTSSSNTSPNN